MYIIVNIVFCKNVYGEEIVPLCGLEAESEIVYEGFRCGICLDVGALGYEEIYCTFAQCPDIGRGHVVSYDMKVFLSTDVHPVGKDVYAGCHCYGVVYIWMVLKKFVEDLDIRKEV